MPVVHQDDGHEKEESEGEAEHEEMDHSSAANESDKGTSDGDSSEDSGSEDSSEMDEEECEHRRSECLDDMIDLERQFSYLKEQWVDFSDNRRFSEINNVFLPIKTVPRTCNSNRKQAQRGDGRTSWWIFSSPGRIEGSHGC